MPAPVARPVIVILAAGGSTRMRGADKLMEPVEGQPQLRRIAEAALATGARVLVTLPPEPGPRAEALSGLAVERVEVADAAKGMGHSIAAGASAAGASRPLMLVPADMPLIGRAELEAMIEAGAAGPDRAWRGITANGDPGHPVLFPTRLVAVLAGLTGDNGAREVLQGETPILVPLAGKAATLDLDTPEDWARFRASGP